MECQAIHSAAANTKHGRSAVKLLLRLFITYTDHLQIIYFIFGPLTMAFGVLLFFAIPTSPMTAWFLTERERKIQVLRLSLTHKLPFATTATNTLLQVIQNHTGIENRFYKHYQVLECFKDPQVWMLFSLAFLQCVTGGGLTAVSYSDIVYHWL